VALSKELLEILACPETKAPLVLSKDGTKLISTDRNSRRCYRVENDIPQLLIDESEILSEEDFDKAIAEAKPTRK